jgi:hypothetical protein
MQLYYESDACLEVVCACAQVRSSVQVYVLCGQASTGVSVPQGLTARDSNTLKSHHIHKRQVSWRLSEMVSVMGRALAMGELVMVVVVCTIIIKSRLTTTTSSPPRAAPRRRAPILVVIGRGVKVEVEVEG